MASSNPNLLVLKGDRHSQRQWKNGWKKPKWMKAAKYYQDAAFYFRESNQTENAIKALNRSYECLREKRCWHRAAITLGLTKIMKPT